MLLEEAARNRRQAPDVGPLRLYGHSRALAQGTVVSSGSIGNRIYTEFSEDEMYAVAPGKDLDRVADEVVVAANRQLADFHPGRRVAPRALKYPC